jgi:transmembrane sensor
MTSSNQRIRDAIAEQADQWLVDNRAGPLDREARAAFLGWLQTSPIHVQEYLRVGTLVCELAAAADDPEFEIDRLPETDEEAPTNVVPLERAANDRVSNARPTGQSRIGARAAAVLAFALTGVVAIWSTRDGERFGLPKTYATVHGQQRVQRLPDGSVLHLNTDSEVTVRYSRDERVIELDRGQALFEVAHEGTRRFRVAAGSAGVVAVGTRFDVYRKPLTTRVTVLDGTVAVFSAPARPLGSGNELPTDALRLTDGFQIEVGDEVGLPRRVDSLASVAWLERRIAFDNQTLGEVAAEFNRYGTETIVIDDEALCTLPVSGVFDAYDVDSFIAFIRTLNDVVIKKTPTIVRVQRRASTR